MNYPIRLSFKLLAIASQIYIRDSGGQLIGYVKQKLFKLKEEINIFADEAQTRRLFTIKADRVLDFSPMYGFTTATGQRIGGVKRHGMRSIFKAHYDIYDSAGSPVMEIHEANAWIKVIDALLGEVPILGMFTGYFLHPAYIVTRSNGTEVARLEKQPAFFEGIFDLKPSGPVNETEETLLLLSVLAMTLLERSRG